jgi:hypothetical protein
LLQKLVKGDRLAQQSQALASRYREARSKLTITETQLLDSILVAESEVTLENALGLVKLEDLTEAIAPTSAPDFQFHSAGVPALKKALDNLIEERRQMPVQLTDWQGQVQEELLGNLTWNFPSVDSVLSRDENLARFPLADVWQAWWENRGAEFQDADGLELLRCLLPVFVTYEDLYKTAADDDGSDTEDEAFEDEVDEAVAEGTSELVEKSLGDLPAAPTHDQTLTVQHGNTSQTITFDAGMLATIATTKAQLQRVYQDVSGQSLTLRYPYVVEGILRWLLYLYPPTQAGEFVLEGLATLLQRAPIEAAARQGVMLISNDAWHLCNFLEGWVEFARSFGTTWTEAQQVRYWQLLNWLDRMEFLERPSCRLQDFLPALQAQAANESDIIFYLLGDRPRYLDLPQGRMTAPIRSRQFYSLSELTARRMSPAYAGVPFLGELADRCRQRILAVELTRGDLPTAASEPALSLQSLSGIATVLQLLQALDHNKLARGYQSVSQSKSTVLSHLMRISFPAASDTPAEFTQRVQSAQIPPGRLIQLAFYAPQWTRYIEAALDWEGFAEGVWWIHAHTKDTAWFISNEIRETWTAQISERTPLSGDRLVDGAVDVAWFQRVYAILGDERWRQLYDAAQYAANGQGHQRAKLFADAMLGNVKAEELLDRITQKRHQDAVRAVGLLPIAAIDQEPQRSQALLNRYETLQDFLRTSKKFGAQRQASEKLAVSIGLENLARTAGYPDPQRLQWAMEAQAIADLAQAPQVISRDDVSVSLAITVTGQPELTITKAGKALKAIPAKLKKDPEIQALSSRKQNIAQQASRMRLSLEQSMIRGDIFAVAELAQLASHAALAPMLRQLLLVGEPAGPIDPGAMELGFLSADGLGLQGFQGAVTPFQSDRFRIAHPHDLFRSGQWSEWQRSCFDQERAQSFKQVFRELYVLTPAEQTERFSTRYEGHQVNPKQAIALFGQRGWLATPYEGIRRTFHEAGLIAEISAMNGYYTPLAVEGLTIDRLQFYPRSGGDYKPVPLAQIPPRLLSEVMRDLDLVVSVAHMGGVDPEASASTVEMRTSLLRETLRLLKLVNVQVQGNHALVAGQLGSYSVHLGSAIVHRQPGGYLCILPVQSQHRGRLFLPFVDEDPKTAEVLSKVVLLAKDKEIQDPTILEQILA